MGLWELFVIAVGLSMDAFAVSVCKGLATKELNRKMPLIVGLWFGVFQALMPLIGYFIGAQFAERITAIDHWIAFGLLLVIGGKMVKESFENGEPNAEGKSEDGDISFRAMLPMAVATSIDALAVGVGFAFLDVRIAPAVSFIGVTTFLLSGAGVIIGNTFGARFQGKAELAGGVVLVLIGVKILLNHLGVISW